MRHEKEEDRVRVAIKYFGKYVGEDEVRRLVERLNVQGESTHRMLTKVRLVLKDRGFKVPFVARYNHREEMEDV